MPQTRADRPWHLVPIALALLVWHGFLAADYVVARFHLAPDLPGAMATLPLEALWARVAWAMAVWLGLAGAFFLLLSDDAAVLLVFAAAIAMLAALAGCVLAGVPQTALGLPFWGAGGALALAPVLGWVYARSLKRRGVLH